MKQGKRTCAVASLATQRGLEYSIHAAKLFCASWLIVLLAIVVPVAAQPALVADVPSNLGNLPDPVYDGPLASIGKSLHDNGIDLRLDYFNIYQSSPTYGFSSTAYGGLIFDVTGHLSPDFRLRLTETFNFPAHNVGGYANVFVGPVRDKSDTDLTRLTFQADFFDDRLLIEAGRMGLVENFLTRGFCDGPACVNSTQGATLHLPEAGLAVWGARAAYKMTPTTTAGFGIVENNTDNWLDGDGWDWEKGSTDGYIAVANIIHEERFIDNPYPLKFEIGAYRRSAAYNDALYDDGPGNPTFSSATPTVITHKNGTNGVYGQVRKVLWSDPNGGPVPKNLAFYGGVFHTLGEGQSYPWEAYAGLEYSGFLPENPLTTVGASIHYIALSEERAQYETNARRVMAGLNQRQSKDTFMFDVHARTGLFGRGVINAGAAYIVNPNTIVPTDFSSKQQKDGFFFYVALAFDLGGSLGLSPRIGP
ncbi:carbohydrate porin [Agrobacterium vitis]|uniref:carbohydrate porin n=1 Tax=Agrobacterium vitis TaxID=373 RepID=UPI0012E71717|nr:carbohydrate porin [Agrobacterium vitis]MVA27249.1 porin [Agrobacterium vitis]